MLNAVAVAKVGHCQAIYTQTPPHENDGVFLFVLPEWLSLNRPVKLDYPCSNIVTYLSRECIKSTPVGRYITICAIFIWHLCKKVTVTLFDARLGEPVGRKAIKGSDYFLCEFFSAQENHA